MVAKLNLAQRIELMSLLFLHGMALGSWFVPLSSVLDQSRLSGLKPWAFAASALAAMLSPLFFGAMADRSVPPAKVLRWISLATAACASLTAKCIEAECPLWLIWVVIQVQSIFCSPTSSLSGSIVFSRLGGSQKQFGSIRALGTIGWMAGCWTTSLMQLDSSPRSFYVSAILWVGLALYTGILPGEQNVNAQPRLTLSQRFGFDALSLLKTPNHRVVFLTAALINIPFAAFYPYTPPMLSELGLTSISAWMSIGQITEVFALVAISSILHRWQLRWVILAGICFGVVRYGLYATGIRWAVLTGLALHGLAFTFTFICAQIYLAEKIEPGWRTRAQALLSFMTSGFGNLAGYLVTGAWLRWNTRPSGGGQSIDWFTYWSGLALIVLAVLLYFGFSYKVQGPEEIAKRGSHGKLDDRMP